MVLESGPSKAIHLTDTKAQISGSTLQKGDRRNIRKTGRALLKTLNLYLRCGLCIARRFSGVRVPNLTVPSAVRQEEHIHLKIRANCGFPPFRGA